MSRAGRENLTAGFLSGLPQAVGGCVRVLQEIKCEPAGFHRALARAGRLSGGTQSANHSDGTTCIDRDGFAIQVSVKRRVCRPVRLIAAAWPVGNWATDSPA